ncbi:MAG: tRNA (guanosine(46)-N7)-methyltransferase TrmB [Longicatena sp.]
MRMRKLPWAEDFLEQQPVVVKNVKEAAGTWKKRLQRDTLHVEIGTGKGDYWIGMAQLYPDAGWIGIEKNVSVAALAVRKYSNLEEAPAHMLYINDDAEDIKEWFAKGEVDVIHLNFSDPWPKKRAHKKRLSNHAFIEQYHHILSDDGEIQMKTDNVSLFEYSVLEFQNEGWFLHEFSVDYRRVEHNEDVITEYEHRFMELGQPIYRAVWKKQPLKNK